MTCKKTLVPLLLIVTGLAGLAGSGCGNYSTEDLEFMNALPEKSDLSADVPGRSAVVLASTAELYRMTPQRRGDLQRRRRFVPDVD